MKLARKLVTLAIVLAMVMAFMIPTGMAATINVQDVLDGETYTAYKILNYTTTASETVKEEDAAYSYYLTAAEYTSIGNVLEAAGFAFTPSADGTQYFVNNAGSFNAADAAAKLANVTTLGDALGKFETTGAGGKATFTDLPIGYYFVTSTTGTFCALHNDTDIAEAVEKNTAPTVEKTQSADGTTYADTTLHLNMGDTVYYQITVTDGTGTNHDIILTDTVTEGITLADLNTIIVKHGDKVATKGTDYTVTETEEGDGFVLTLDDSYVASLEKDDAVIIQYTAVVNEKAAIDSDTGNSNTVEMKYSEQEMEKFVYVATYDILLKKTNEEEVALAGAKFNLYREATGGTAITLEKDATGYYVSAAEGSAAEIDAADGNGVNIRGLEPGTYYLEETVAPDGYNKLAVRQPVTITAGTTAAATVTVVNQAGVVLPSTGGIGTTIFYVLGGVLFLGALVILFTNKRMRQN